MKYLLAASKPVHVRATHFLSGDPYTILSGLNLGSVLQLSNWLQLFSHFCQTTKFYKFSDCFLKCSIEGAPRCLSRLSVLLRLGHDLAVRGFEPCVGLCADSSESGACFGCCDSLSLCPSPTRALSHSVSQNK